MVFGQHLLEKFGVITEEIDPGSTANAVGVAIGHAFQPVPVVAVLLAIAAILLRRPKFRASKQFHHRTGQQTGRAQNG